MPNVTGYHTVGFKGQNDPYGDNSSYSGGSITLTKVLPNMSNSVGGWYRVRVNHDNSRVSNQYQNISEVRVKSIISIGFIKLY